MITIKINGRKKHIKKYSELTIKEYLELINLLKDNTTFNIFNYIAFQTGYTFDDLKLQKVTNLKLLSESIGKLRVVKGESEEKIFCIEDLKPKKYFEYNNYLFDINKVKMSSKLGYRAVIEQYIQTKPSYLDIYIFTLATVIRERKYNDFDYDSIIEIKNNLYNYNAYDVLSAGAFFFTNLMSGGRSVLKCLKVLNHLLTRMRG